MNPSIEKAVSELQGDALLTSREDRTQVEIAKHPTGDYFLCSDVQQLAAQWAKDKDQLERENTALRAMVVKHECPYGHRLPDGVCKLGYPGCSCADDAACHEDETVRRIIKDRDQLLKERAELEATLEREAKRCSEAMAAVVSATRQHTALINEALYYRSIIKRLGGVFCDDCGWPIPPCDMDDHTCTGQPESTKEHAQLAAELAKVNIKLYSEIRSEQEHGRSKYGNGPNDFKHDDANTDELWHACIADHTRRAACATPMERRQHLLKVAGLAISAIEAFDRKATLASGEKGAP